MSEQLIREMSRELVAKMDKIQEDVSDIKVNIATLTEQVKNSQKSADIAHTKADRAEDKISKLRDKVDLIIKIMMIILGGGAVGGGLGKVAGVI